MPFTPFPKQTQVILLEGVPLTPDYDNTTRYLTATAQESDFLTYNHIMLAPNSYQRAGKGTIRIAKQADEIYRYNYMMFKNQIPAAQFAPHYSDKWFYCFITDIEYINDNTCEITYEIDVLQTYMFDFALGMNYVEREHSDTDAYGDHITDEGLQVGDMVTYDTYDMTYNIYNSADYPWRIVFYYVANEEYISSATQYFDYGNLQPGEPQSSDIRDTDRSVFFDGTYAGVSWTYLNARFNNEDNIDSARTNISKMVNKLLEIGANIVSIEIVPNWTLSPLSLNEGTAFTDTQGTAYTPKNKKLYCYPYRYLRVSNYQGQMVTYKWEDFKVAGWSNNSPMQARFLFTRSRLPTLTIMAYPDPAGYSKPSIECGVTVPNTNLVAWSEDSYAKWWAQNGTSFVMNIISQSLGAVAQIVGTALTAGTAAGAVSSGSETAPMAVNSAIKSGTNSATGIVSDVLGDISTYRTHKDTPDALNGTLSQNTIINALGKYGFAFYDTCLRARDAKIIDDFFTKYGYAVKRVKLPNLSIYGGAGVRPHWNYLKLKNCTLSDSFMPAFAEEKICSIFNTGVTVWHNLSEVGNYSLDNSPPN